ncbi:MAG: hypothetical protein VST70_01540 [Nitrospirota bacterium]|nr:hypothetical protein [Nitrospirota bacterium]
MSFKNDHPNYQSYEDKELYFSKLPKDMGSVLQGFLIRMCERDSDKLKEVVNLMAARIPMEVTTNWGWDFLIGDLSRYSTRLCEGPLPKVMDFWVDLCTNEAVSCSGEDLNEFLEDFKVGYFLNTENYYYEPTWELRKSVSSRIGTVEETVSQVKDICSQTMDHLNQAKEHLKNTTNDRDRKDAIRDCLSAVESLLKNLSGENDIQTSTRRLIDGGSWGPKSILKEGLTIWDKIHNDYPDVRHGNPKRSDITDEETLYWIERMTCFINYLSRLKNRMRS